MKNPFNKPPFTSAARPSPETTVDDDFEVPTHPEGNYSVVLWPFVGEPETKYGVVDYDLHPTVLVLRFSERTSMYYPLTSLEKFMVNLTQGSDE